MFFSLLTLVKMEDCIYKIRIAHETREDNIVHEFYVDSIGSPSKEYGINIKLHSINPWNSKIGVFVKVFRLDVTQGDISGVKDGKKVYSKKLLIPEICWNIHFREKFFSVIFYNICRGLHKRLGLFYCSRSSSHERFDEPFEEGGKIKDYIVDEISRGYEDYSVIEKFGKERLFKSDDKKINKMFAELIVRLAVACLAKKRGVEDNDEFKASLGFEPMESHFRDTSTGCFILERCVLA